VTVVVKFGGELLDDAANLRTVTAVVASSAKPLVIVHGGGREIDAALKAAGIEKVQVDGLRITDAATLDIVVSVLAGSVNTRFVAALGAAGVRGVGLTGVDGGCGRCERAPMHRSVDGREVDLGYVGNPSDSADVSLLRVLVGTGFVPVIACIGVDDRGQRLNVNADTLATMPILESAAIADIVECRTATAGMIAKLRACEHAVASGVEQVLIVDGRDGAALADAIEGIVPAMATQVVARLKPRATPASCSASLQASGHL
jgi:acetylglutamate kinase